MQLANNTIRQTHYDILNVKEDASQEEIRTRYKSALLTSHPDKLQQTTNSNHNDPQSRFLEIQTAWEILGDVKSRALYDMELRVSRQEDVIADEIEIEDLAVEASSDSDVVELFYQCRCGDYFSVDSLELGEMGFQVSTEGLTKPDLQKVAINFPEVLCRDVDKILKPNLDYLKTRGFDSQQIATLVARCPPILIESVKNSLEPRIRFLVEVMDRRIEEAADYHEFFQHGLKKRLERREKLLKERNISCSLSEMLDCNHKRFLSRFDLVKRFV